MKLYLSEQHEEDGVHWLVMGDAPNSDNGLDCKGNRALAERLIAAGPERCQVDDCGLPAVFEIIDSNEHRPDHCGTLTCENHLGHLVGSVPPTLPDGPWTVRNYPD